MSSADSDNVEVNPLPAPSRAMVTEQQVFNAMPKDTSALQPFSGSAARLNKISALAAAAGQAMPRVFDMPDTTSQPAGAYMTQAGEKFLAINQIAPPDVIIGAVAHEFGHLKEMKSASDYARNYAALANDISGALSQQQERAADMYAVRLGQGQKLIAALQFYDKANVVDPHDTSHPSIASRIAAIDTALKGLNLSQGQLNDADYGNKAPPSTTAIQPTPGVKGPAPR